ncbi:AsmA family protein, partial [Francisellaceae bacterium]|nr:AsmA family protein [Francisellaceae bacterium]
MKIIKWLAITIICIIILIIAAAVILPNFMDSSGYKAQLQAIVKKNLGRELVIEGDITLRLFPTSKLIIDSVYIKNPGNFPQQEKFISFKELTANITMFSFLFGKPVIESIKFTDVNVNLRRNAKGENNWNVHKQISQSKENHSQTVDNKSTQKKQVSSLGDIPKNRKMNFSLNSIQFENVKIDYQSPISHKYGMINYFNFHFNSNELPIAYKTDVSFSTKYIKNASSAGSGTVNIIDNVVTLSGVAQQFNVISRDYGNYNVNISGNFEYNAENEKLRSNLNVYVQNLLNAYLHNIVVDSASSKFSMQVLIDNAQEAAIFERFGITLPTSTTSDPSLVWDVQNLSMDVTGDNSETKSLKIENISGQLGRSKIYGNYKILSEMPFKSQFNLNVTHLHLSDYVNLNGAEIFFKKINVDGHVDNDKLLMGDMTVTSKLAILKGVDLNVSAMKFQDFLESVVHTRHIGESFENVRQEIATLNSLGTKIDSDNGKETRLYDLYMLNTLNENTIYTKKFNWHGNEFYFDGTGQLNWESKQVNYALRVFVYNQINDDLKDYQKV